LEKYKSNLTAALTWHETAATQAKGNGQRDKKVDTVLTVKQKKPNSRQKLVCVSKLQMQYAAVSALLRKLFASESYRSSSIVWQTL
ncbi:MAG: hypothetical protein ABR566_19060, partial [Pyrinomonadaceae bacterium]